MKAEGPGEMKGYQCLTPWAVAKLPSHWQRPGPCRGATTPTGGAGRALLIGSFGIPVYFLDRTTF